MRKSRTNQRLTKSELERRKKAVDAMIAFGKEHRGRLRGLSIRNLINEGRLVEVREGQRVRQT